MVIAHLGNGASITAVANGQSQDTSMGLTPLEGLVMGTRSGDIDPAVFSFLAENANMTISQITEMLRERVLGYLGFLGLHIDQEANLKARFGNAGVITTADSKAVAVVIPTNEELMIAHDTARLSGL